MYNEYWSGVVLYRYKNGQYEYMVVRDRQDRNVFPKDRHFSDENDYKCAERVIREKVGLDVVPDTYFSYPVNDSSVDGAGQVRSHYLMANIGNADFVPLGGETKEIWMLPYEEAFRLLSFGELKDVLKEVNDRLVSNMKICCMFREGAEFHRSDLEVVKYYGSECNGHRLYTHDEGDRCLFRCRRCGGYVLEQESEIHFPDTSFTDYYPVRDESHAEEINRKYDGWSIETDYPYKKIFFTHRYD